MKIDLDKIEPLTTLNGEQVLKKPEGTNNLSSRGSFIQRKIYEQEVHNKPTMVKNKPLDILYDKMFLARLNEEGAVIQPKKMFMVSIPQRDNSSLLAFDFVVEAFIELKKTWLGLLNKNILNQESIFYNLNVKKGFQDPGSLYYDLMNAYYKNFVRFVKKNKLKNDILDFNDFLKVFISFLDTQITFKPFLFSSFIASRFNTPLATGLVLDLLDFDCGNDKIKEEQVFKDLNFEAFRERAKRYGFNIDKNIPWRIYFDISSIAAKPFLDKRDLDENNLFQKYYEEVNINDIELLKTYIVNFYNIYISKKKTVSIIKSDCSINIQKIKRIEIKKEDIEQKLFDRLYIYIFAKEKNLNWFQNQFEDVVQNFILLKTKLDFHSSLRYSVAKVGTELSVNQKNTSFRF